MRLPNVGDVFENRYELRRKLGEGGFASVFLAWDPRTTREVVIKVLSPNLEGGYPSTLIARFEREAQIFATLSNPYIVTMYDFGRTSDGLLFMVFENVEGRDLNAVLADEQRLPAGVAMHVLQQMLEALRAAHQRGVLHRDLKPANILIYAYGGNPYCAKLIDFGIAHELDAEAPRLTQTGRVVGTVRYMAPEQVFGEPMTPASDIFSMGLVAWEMLTGRPAIAGETHHEMLREQASTEPFRVPPGLAPPELSDVVERMLAREVVDRFSSVEQVLATLRNPQPNVPAGPPQGARPQPRKSANKLPIALGVAAVALVAAVAIAMNFTTDERPPVRQPAKRSVTGLVQNQAGTEPSAKTVEPESEPEPETFDPCTAEPPFRGYGRLRFGSFGQGMTAYIPESYDSAKPAALVLGFHRRLREGRTFIETTGLTAMAEKHNWVIVAPEADGFAAWAKTPETAIRAVDLATSQLCIDRRQLHLVGDEAGSSYVHTVSCSIPVSTAIAAFAPAGRGTCEPVAPNPYLRLFTKQDTIHPSDGKPCAGIIGELGSWASIEANIRGAYKCQRTSKPWDTYSDACKVLDECSRGPAVICGFDGGHRWPHGEDNAFLVAGCGEDPPTKAPMPEAVAAFIEEFGHELTDEEIATIDRLRGIEAP